MWGLLFASLIFLYSDMGFSLDSPTHVGCFYSDVVEEHREYYTIETPLPWSEAVAFCNHRLVKYMGLKEDESAAHFKFVFCGNSIPQDSKKAESSLCHPCQDNKTYDCGGLRTLSVYELREQTPLQIVMAYDSGIHIYSPEEKDITLQYGEPIYAVDYVYSQDTIFAMAYSSFVRTEYNNFFLTFNTIKHVYSHYSILQDLSVDWKCNEMYWLSSSSCYKNDLDLDFDFRYYINLPSEHEELSLDPFFRKIFAIKNSNLVSFSLETEHYMVYENLKRRIPIIKKISVDVHHQLIYIIGAQDDGSDQYYLGTVNYDDSPSELHVLYTGTLCHNAFSLDVYNDTVVWGTRGDNWWYTIHMCLLTPRCNPDNITQLFSSSEAIHDIKIYHPERQTPSTKYLCADYNCSHGCEKSSPFTVTCTCPQGMVLGHYNTCRDSGLTSTGLFNIEWNLSVNNEETPSTSNHFITKTQTFLLTLFTDHLNVVIISTLAFTLLCLMYLCIKQRKTNKRVNRTSSLTEMNVIDNEYVDVTDWRRGYNSK